MPNLQLKGTNRSSLVTSLLQLLAAFIALKTKKAKLFKKKQKVFGTYFFFNISLTKV